MYSRKKLIFLLLFLALTSTQIAFANEITVGTIINKVYSTDIKAFVNGWQIPSRNIDGYTVIIAEDLRNYGFDVIWNPGDRSLRITENLAKELKPVIIESTAGKKAGELLGDVIFTDIKTYLGNKEVQSYNIGGYTTILMRELAEWGSVMWDEEKREVEFISGNLGNEVAIVEDINFGFKINKLSIIQMNIENKEDKFYYKGKEVGFYDGPAMLSLKNIAGKFGYVFSTDDDGLVTIKNGSYSFKISGNNQKALTFFDGKLFEERELWYKPAFLNNDIFVADVDLVALFGLNKQWDVETRNIFLSYLDYDVNDYGIYEILGEEFLIKAVSEAGSSIKTFIGVEELGIKIFNRLLNNERSSGSFLSRPPYFVAELRVPLAYENNELDIAITYKDRILLLKTLENITPNIRTHQIQKEKSLGPWTSIKLKIPKQDMWRQIGDNSKLMVK